MDSLFQVEITKIGFLYCFATFLCVVIIGASYFLSLSLPDVEKVSVYECGFDPYEDARNVFDVRFYLVAILFIVFDLEALYIIPFASTFGLLDANAYWYMVDFIIELLVGYVYAWRVGALNWS